MKSRRENCMWECVGVSDSECAACDHYYTENYLNQLKETEYTNSLRNRNQDYMNFLEEMEVE